MDQYEVSKRCDRYQYHSWVLVDLANQLGDSEPLALDCAAATCSAGSAGHCQKTRWLSATLTVMPPPCKPFVMHINATACQKEEMKCAAPLFFSQCFTHTHRGKYLETCDSGDALAPVWSAHKVCSPACYAQHRHDGCGLLSAT